MPAPPSVPEEHRKKKAKKKKHVDAWWTPLVPKSLEDDVAKGISKGDKLIYHTPMNPFTAAPILGLRAVNDLRNAAIGLPATLKTVGTAAWHDFNNESLLTGDPFDKATWRKSELGKVGKAIVDDYRHTYGPAFHGDFETTRNRIAQHPLGPVLDVMTVVTMGAGGAAKVGTAVARTAKEGSKLEAAGRAVSGMQRVKVPAAGGAALTAGDAKAFIAKETAGQRRVKGATIKGTNDEVLLPAKRVIVGETRKVDETANMSPRPMLRNGAERDLNRETLGGEAVDIGRYSSNPAIRVRQRAFDALSEAMPSSWVIGAERRSARLNKQSTIRDERIRVARGGAREMSKAAARMEGRGNANLRTAFHYAAQGVDPRMKLEQLKRDADYLASMTDEDVSGLTAMEKLLTAKDAKSVATADALLAEKGVTREQALMEVDHFLRGAADRRIVLTHARTRQREIQNLLDKPLNQRQTKILNEALDRVGRISDQTTATLKDAGVNPRADVATMPQRIAGAAPDEVVAPPAIIPQVMGRTSKRARKKMAAGNRNLHAPPRPDSAKVRTGMADRFGMETMDPRTIVWMNKQANVWLTQKKLWQSVIDRSREVPADGHLPKGWVRVPTNQWESFMSTAQHMFDEELPAAFGDSPQLAELQELFGQAVRDKVSGRDIMVPQQYAGKLLNELKPTSQFPVLDKATAAWRLATVSALRPAFLVNNIIGQTALLLLSQNTLAMVGSLLSADNRGLLIGKDARAMRAEASAGIVGHGINREIARETRRAAHAVPDRTVATKLIGKPIQFASDVNDAIGRFSGAISDDPFRRLAFANEIRKPAIKILRARRKENPSFTYQDAMREVLDDEALMDRIERKVLGDLVDFEDLSRGEREILRRFSPFYSWIKGSSKITARLLLERPELANVLYRAGEQGYKDQVREWGKVPDWVYGQLKIGKPDESGNQRTMSTMQFNPFVTPVDQMSQLLQPFGLNPSGAEYGGENLLSGASPVVKMLLAGGSGVDPFTGTTVAGGSAASRALGVYGMSFPQLRAIQNTGKDYGIMRYPGLSAWLQYAGDPTRLVNVEAAQEAGSKPPRDTRMLRIPVGGEDAATTVIGDRGYRVIDAGDPADWGTGPSNGRRKRRTRRKRKVRKARS